MDSPYHPGFGARPAVLVGRDKQLARAAATLTRVANSGGPAPSVLVLTGARGLGKTVTLGVIRDDAAARGFVTATLAFDSVSDNAQLLAARVAEAIAPFADRASDLWEWFRQRLSRLSLELNTGVVKITSPTRPDNTPKAVPTGHRQALVDLLVTAAKISAAHGKSGLAVALDELQEAPNDQLVIIANALQEALADQAAPLAVFAAGLPNTPEAVMSAASFTERFDFRVLEPLDHTGAERALLEPALALQVRWDPTAATTALEAAGGSPYLIQRVGDESWMAAQPTPGQSITPSHAEAAVEELRESLGAGMFRGRWAKATYAEKELLVAIAQVATPQGVALTRHLTALTGKTTPQLSTARSSLIDKGLIEAVGRGQLRFTMPGFGEFVRNLLDAPWYGPQLEAGQIPADQLALEDPHPLDTDDHKPSNNA